MKKAAAVLFIAVFLAAGTNQTAFAAQSYGGGGGGGIVTVVGVDGNWVHHTCNNSDRWTFENAAGERLFAGEWAYISNPYSKTTTNPQWFLFDAEGFMLNGWQWVKGTDGVTKCYYLHTSRDGDQGRLYQSETTPDGYTVDSNGAWVVKGVVQTKNK